MKTILRALGISVAAFFLVVFTTGTFVFIKKFWFGGKTPPGHGKRIAIVDVSGLMTSSSAALERLEELASDPSIKAIVVRINSPGGLVGPSQELFEGFKRTDKKIPILVSMGSVAASGGYYAALGGRKIFASPGTLTASIGVIMEFANTQKLYEWAKVERFALTAGKMKSAGNEFRPMTAEERELFTKLLEDIHGQFKKAVKERRKISDAEIEKWCDGRVMSGAQAHAAKLVDALGGLEDALLEAKRIAGVPADAEVLYPEKKEGVLKKLIFGSEDGADSALSGFWRLLSERIPSPPLGGWQVLLLSPVR